MKYSFVYKDNRRGHKVSLVETDYYIGDIVYIHSTGGAYTSYRNAYLELGLDIEKSQSLHNYVKVNGHYFAQKNNVYSMPFVVKNFAFHETTDDLLVAIENKDTCLVISSSYIDKLNNVFAKEDCDKTLVVNVKRISDGTGLKHSSLEMPYTQK